MRTVALFGATYTLNDQVDEFAFMEFAAAAADAQDGDTMEGLASIYEFVKACITDADWPRFRRAAKKNKAGAADLLPVINAMFEVQAERPTGQSSDSSDGLPDTDPKSESNSEGKDSPRHAGRPDLQLAVARSA